MQRMTKARYRLENSPLYGLRSRSRLAKLLGVTNSELRHLSRQSESLYAEFGIPKASGGMRDIENPATRLKIVQAKLANLLSRIEPGRYLFCPVKGRSYISNASQHLGNNHVHCLDIHKFFPSVTSRRVFWFFCTVMHCAEDIAGLLVNISTFKQHLPTGSPLSPILAYFSYLDMWEAISNFCFSKGYVVTVYVDDIAISGSTVYEIDIWHIKKIIHSYGLKYHKERNFRSRPAAVTGCILAYGNLQVPFAQYRKRRLLNAASKQTAEPLQKEKIERSVIGLQTQMKQIGVDAERAKANGRHDAVTVASNA